MRCPDSAMPPPLWAQHPVIAAAPTWRWHAPFLDGACAHVIETPHCRKLEYRHPLHNSQVAFTKRIRPMLAIRKYFNRRVYGWTHVGVQAFKKPRKSSEVTFDGSTIGFSLLVPSPFKKHTPGIHGTTATRINLGIPTRISLLQS